ncbi:MFS transporter [Arthrobacter sp. 24S4-2]|uniref:MFS transporter n=1 Tax=Arthrobacter sp. 24S4-2 TaxID=2575374 RepID=UPI001C310D11|nr:MFS transporter [Arthrobacter sp. 24S4-2]
MASRPAEAAVYRKISLRLLPFLLLLYTFAYLDRVNIGFAKLHMSTDIGLSEAAYGLGAGLFFLGYALFEVPSNLLLVRIGIKKTIMRIMCLWGLTAAAMAFVQNETAFYVLRLLLGVFEAGFAPGIIFYLTYWYSTKRMAGAMAIFMLAGPIGSMIGGLSQPSSWNHSRVSAALPAGSGCSWPKACRVLSWLSSSGSTWTIRLGRPNG